MLEAKLYLGHDLVCSIASETIQNSEEYISQSDDRVKQDCESKAFVRLAEKIKKRFPRLPVIITADGLYVTQRVLQICKDYGWDYIIRYKEGCAASIEQEYRALPEKENAGDGIEYQNQIPFGAFDVNLIYYKEKKSAGRQGRELVHMNGVMKMKKKTIKKRILAGLLAFALIVPANVAGAKTQTVLETNVTEASEGCTLVGVYGSYFAQAKEALAKINEIRKEACEAGNIRDPRNSGRYLQPSDYVPLKWSSDLEYIARIRAAEAGIAFRFMDSGHDRLNEKGTFSIGSNGITSSSEDLAYYYVKDMIEGVLLWYSEKQYWVKQDFSEETRHYTSMINPKYTHVGFGGFYSEAAPYPATMAGAKSDLDETMMEVPEDVMQKIEVSNDYIQETYLDGDDQIFTNGTTTVTPRVKLRRNNAIRNVWSMEDVTYTSSDPAVATVTQDGQVTGITNGTVTITAKSGDTIVAQKEITVKCNHPRKMISYTESTCTKEGKKQYYCATCHNTIEEVVAKKAHDYVYGEADSEGKSTGKCSVCGDTIHIAPPTNMKLYWRNSTSSISSYSPVFPTSNPVGSLLYCWIQASDGNPDYQDMVMESTNEEVAGKGEQ